MMEKQLIPAGYKQTEVGVIPEDWDVLEIQEIAKIGSGTTPARIQEDRYFKNGVSCWVKTLDLNNSVIRVTEEKVTDLALKETCLQVYPKGTVLVAMYGGFNQIGRTGILEVPASVNQAIVAVQVSGNYNSRYLLDTLNYRVEYWKSVASSSRKDPNITSVDVKQFKLGLPSTKQEQTAIANALSDVDALIAALEKLINKKSAIKTAAMQQLLTGKKRLPPFNQLNTGYKQTELGEIPGDWGVNDVGHFNPFVTSGSRGWANYYSNIGSLFVRITNMRRSSIYLDLTNKKYVLLPLLSAEGKRTELQNNDVLISITADVGISGYVDDSIEKPAYINQHIALVRFTGEEIYPKFVSYYLASENIQKLFRGSTDQGAKAGMNLTAIRTIKFAVPTKQEQTAIANVLSDMDKDLEALEQRLHKTQQIKQGMMQELLTGKTRLVSAKAIGANV